MFFGVSDIHGDENWPCEDDGGEGVLVIVRVDRTHSGLNGINPVAWNPLMIFCFE